MTQSFGCRKRCRNDSDEENSEFTPLSKRINNLHINNTLLTATATVDTLCHGNHHECYVQSMNGGLNTGTGQEECVGQWNGALVNGMCHTHQHTGREVMNPPTTSVQQCLARHLLEQQQHPPAVLHHYNPDLSPSENPFYYDNNRLLFNLHMESLQRTNNYNYLIN